MSRNWHCGPTSSTIMPFSSRNRGSLPQDKRNVDGSFVVCTKRMTLYDDVSSLVSNTEKYEMLTSPCVSVQLFVLGSPSASSMRHFDTVDSCLWERNPVDLNCIFPCGNDFSLKPVENCVGTGITNICDICAGDSIGKMAIFAILVPSSADNIKAFVLSFLSKARRILVGSLGSSM